MTSPQPQSSFRGSTAPATGAQGSNVFTRKLGPLPVWGWMGVGLSIALVYYIIKKKNSTSTTGTDTTANPDTTTASSQIPQFVIQDYSSPVYDTATASATANPTATATSTVPPTPPTPPDIDHHGMPPPDNDHHNPPPHPAQKYVTVTVTKFHKVHPAWNSTLSGIAGHYHVAGGYQKLAQLNHISNPNLIYPGQKIKVPV